MSLRTFVDPQGKEWEVLAVVPRQEERRHYDRRSGEVHLVNDGDGDEDRREYDRRLTVGGAERMEGKRGWLAFASAGEKRRLTPIPDNWTHCSDAELAAYLDSARPVRHGSLSS